MTSIDWDLKIKNNFVDYKNLSLLVIKVKDIFYLLQSCIQIFIYLEYVGVY